MSNLNFRIKVCGIRTVEDAIAAADAGADAIGLNFYEGSARYIDPPSAKKISAEAHGRGVTVVGVFVNAAAISITQLANDVGLDVVQLHGDESTGIFKQLGGLPTMRAIRWKPGSEESWKAYLEAGDLSAGGREAVQSILIDSHSSGGYGGTGKVVDWGAADRWRLIAGRRRLVLAGGLVPENVASAIEIAKPDAVDTASGVETSPGVKNLEKLASFVAEARRGFGLIAKDG